MSEEEKNFVVIIGAGVVGCALAQELSAQGFTPFVLERGPRIAEGITSRNSGVIHAGLYYPPESLKAQACIRGKNLLYEWCKKYHVPYLNTGKWVVGSADDEAELIEIYENALKSGATGLEMGTQEKMKTCLKGIKADIGFYSSETGIVDPYEYSRSMQIIAEENGAEFLLNTHVQDVEVLAPYRYRIHTSRGEIESEWIVNAAGLYADEIAAMAGIHKYKIYPWRGHYFKLSSPQKYSYLVYPVKKKKAAGLGIHLTLSLDGSYKLGPDVELIQSKENFGSPETLEQRQRLFFEAASRYLDGVQYEQLSYDSCGIRPKLRSPTDTDEKDFVISEDLPGWINLVGIESPGLTASRDLAQRVVKLCS